MAQDTPADRLTSLSYGGRIWVSPLDIRAVLEQRAELLAVAKRLVSMFPLPEMDEFEALLSEARAAITKAEGG